MRLLVCGGREYADREKVFQVLDAFHRQSGPVTLLIHGGAGRRRVLMCIAGGVCAGAGSRIRIGAPRGKTAPGPSRRDSG